MNSRSLMWSFPCACLTSLIWLGSAQAAAVAASDFPPPFNSEKRTTPLTPAVEAAGKFKVPEGFKVTLFAGEPDVQQPIGMTFDSRGRLWVAENYTYGESAVNFDMRLRDRVLVFEDTNGDGKFDTRKVFTDRLQRLTSVEVGFGGVWVLAAPQLLFIPDRNGDGVPDGEPEVVLDGWDSGPIRHNIVNGLRWGPDGWLYGRHGIQAPSFVGAPGTPQSARTKLSCCIWRYHPTRKLFEVVTEGTTNPWGHDWDADGELFFVNTVIGHFWHAIPGAHLKRMYGEDFNRHVYGLMDQHADHYHWDTGKNWTDSREAAGKSDGLGGGHAHEGLMIYQGNNWPASYRDGAFMINFHGRRLNHDILTRSGAGYVAKHGSDMLFTDDVWFRGLDLMAGPDGGVYLSDWSDIGECHDHDGVHRLSGRIYKVTYGTPVPPKQSVAEQNAEQLVDSLADTNEWVSRMARLRLQEMAASGADMKRVEARLKKAFSSKPNRHTALRLMWGLNSIGAADESWLSARLNDSDEHVRSWAVRLLMENRAPSEKTIRAFEKMARSEKSGLVRLYLSSALQRMPVEKRSEIAARLAEDKSYANDPNLPLMVWYGAEPVVASNVEKGVDLFRRTQWPLLRKYVARRMAEDVEKNPVALNLLMGAIAKYSDAQAITSAAQGMTEAFRGLRKVAQPAGWEAFQKGAEATGAARDLVRGLGLLFGDGRALEALKQVVLDTSADGPARRSALQAILQSPSGDLSPMLKDLIKDRALGLVALQGLMASGDTSAPKLALDRFKNFPQDERQQVLAALCAKPQGAAEVLDAISDGRILRQDVSAYHARQIRSLRTEMLDKKLSAVWGDIRGTSEEKTKLAAKYRKLLTPERLSKADAKQGKVLFNQVCGVCHTLYGEGAALGPDLTGSGRQSLDYLLENILDPSAVVAVDYKMSVVTLKDGRVVTGLLGPAGGRTRTLQAVGQKFEVEPSEITQVETSNASIMPEGLLEALDEKQVSDLVAYLMSPSALR